MFTCTLVGLAQLTFIEVSVPNTGALICARLTRDAYNDLSTDFWAIPYGFGRRDPRQIMPQLIPLHGLELKTRMELCLHHLSFLCRCLAQVYRTVALRGITVDEQYLTREAISVWFNIHRRHGYQLTYVWDFIAQHIREHGLGSDR